MIYSSLGNGMKDSPPTPFTAAQSQVTGIWSLLQPPVR